jgi:hypothetical protein
MAGKCKLGDWRQPYFDGFCPSEIDWAQLASFIDGEGSILINTQKCGRKNSGLYLRVTVANTDVRLMEWLKIRFGGTYKDANTKKYYEGKNWKTAYHWGASSNRGAWVLHNCMKYFVLKAEQAQIGIDLQTSLSRNHLDSGKLSDSTREERAILKQRLLVLKRKGIDLSTENTKMANAS